MTASADVQAWLRDPDPQTFPYDTLLGHFREVGKHFVGGQELALLDQVRDRLADMQPPPKARQLLTAFLDTALDKFDGRYDYQTYLALPLLPQPTVDEPVEQAVLAGPRCDRLLMQLVGDALAFEMAAARGKTDVMPEMRPSRASVDKRCRHGLRALRPALERQSLEHAGVGRDGSNAIDEVCAAIRADMSAIEERTIDLSLLPVATVHDEYLFLRVLQSFETTFSLIAVQLHAAVQALAACAAERAAQLVSRSADALTESAPLFSMLATMQIEAFRTFRQHTEGASAIQSRNYKIVES